MEITGSQVVGESDSSLTISTEGGFGGRTTLPGYFVVVQDNGDLCITDTVPDGKASVNQIDYKNQSNPSKFTKTKEMFLLNNKIVNSAANLLITDKSSGKQYTILLQTGPNSFKPPGGSAENHDIKKDAIGNVKMADSLFTAAMRELGEEAFGLSRTPSSSASGFLSKDIGLGHLSACVQIEETPQDSGNFVRAGRPEFNVNTCLSPAVVISCEVDNIHSIEDKLRVEDGHSDEKPVLMDVSELLSKSKEKDVNGKSLYNFRDANFTLKSAIKGELTGITFS